MYVRAGSPYRPFIAGGGKESGLKSGTENLPGIAALHAIFTELNKTTASVFQPEAVLWQHRQQLLDALRQVFPALVLNSQDPYIVPTTLNFSVPGFYSKDIMDLFDAAGIHVSSGSACSSKVPTSFVLDAMRLETWRSPGRNPVIVRTCHDGGGMPAGLHSHSSAQSYRAAMLPGVI